MPKNQEHKKQPDSDESVLDDYTTVRLPKELMEEIDSIINRGIRGYKSRSEFIKEAIRRRFEELNVAQPMPKLSMLEHFNTDENGVKVVDRAFASKTSMGKVIQVYLKPDLVWCSDCQTSSCRHTEFALELPVVQEILAKKGWKIKA